MIKGTTKTSRTASEVREILRPVLAAANCEILHEDADTIRLRHGTYLASAAPLLPKLVVLNLSKEGDMTRIDYQVKVSGFAKGWATFIAILFFWLIFPPIVVRRAFVHHPRQFIVNLLRSVE